MADNVKANLAGLRSAKKIIESFKSHAAGQCKTMQGGISGCAACMKDESQALIGQARDIVDELLKAIEGPTERVLEKIRTMEAHLNQDYGFSR